MVSENNLLSKLAALVAGFDDASWEALASKGLLRRARKDIEKGIQIEVVEQTTDAIKMEVSPYLVSMPASGPAGANCSCPAPGVCQHILVAGLYLQSRDSAGTEKATVQLTGESIRDEIVLLTAERLKSWAGSADYKQGVTLFEKNTMAPVIEYSETVLVRLMPSAIEIRFVPGAGLNGMISPKSLGKRAAVAAVLALRKQLGFEVPVTTAQQSLVELGGTPRTRKEILDSACSVLEAAVSIGLSHVSEFLTDRLVTLAVSAQGAHMPRVSLALRTVSDEVKSILKREARADEARLLLLMARVFALMEAIRAGNDNQSAELAGTHRAQYVEVPEIELSGVGAYTWQTGSGYVGLTVLFWADHTKEFLSWSYARPEIQRVDARQRFYGEGPWEGSQSPQQVAASKLKLRSARRTANGRLSSSSKTSALVISPVAAPELDFGERLFTSWEMVERYVSGKQALGLRDPNPLDLIVVLRPALFGTRSFDAISQTFTWEVFDEMNRVLRLTLPFRDWTKESIRILEQLSPPQGATWRFVVRLVHQDDKVFVEPISILRTENKESPVYQLAFDSLPQQAGGSVSQQSTEAAVDEDGFQDEEIVDGVENNLPARGSLTGIVTELNRRLETIAEAGTQKGLTTHRDWFLASRQDVNAFGLTALANALSTLSKPSAQPDAILKTRYLTHIHMQALSHLR
jgi:hypothetical protein